MTTDSPYEAPHANVETVAAGATQKVKPLSAKGRIGRARYVAYSFGISILIGIAMMVLVGLAVMVPGIGGILAGIVALVLYIAIIVVWVLLTIQRCHDMGASGWLALAAIIPLAVFVFWFVPGARGPNRWGAPPEPNSTGVIVLALLMVGLFGLGILTAILAPALLGDAMQHLPVPSGPVSM
jgi:uncharacterized membrane protein YhaH (DUF805 family)